MPFRLLFLWCIFLKRGYEKIVVTAVSVGFLTGVFLYCGIIFLLRLVKMTIFLCIVIIFCVKNKYDFTFLGFHKKLLVSLI